MHRRGARPCRWQYIETQASRQLLNQTKKGAEKEAENVVEKVAEKEAREETDTNWQLMQQQQEAKV
jgi:hypothetical protein